MSTKNATNAAVTVINRANADIKAFSAAAEAAALVVNGKCSDDGTATGTPDTTIDTQYDAIVAAVVAIDAQIDVLFPVAQLEANAINIVSGVVENAAPTKIVMALTEPGVITDATGFTISGSTLATSISSAAISGAGFGVLTLTANGAVANAETVLISYNGATGNLVNKNNAGDAAGSITDLEVTNNVAA